MLDYIIMSASRHSYLIDWRNTHTLVRKNQGGGLCVQKVGKTFRGRHSSVQVSSQENQCATAAWNDEGRGAGTAKPGPTTDTSSRIARIKKIQTRTRTNFSTQQSPIKNRNGTDRGAHPSVQNASTGADSKSRRAQLFGHLGTIPGHTSGKGGNSSDVIYFKNVFSRVSLNTVAESGNN